MITVEEIVEEYLRKNGYDGLYCDDCACKLDDLFSCNAEWIKECKAGYLQQCQKCSYSTVHNRKIICNYDFDFCIGEKEE